MGHSTATVFVPKDHIKNPADHNSIVSAGVRIWLDEEAGRWDDPRHGYPRMFPLMTPDQRYRMFNKDESLVRDDKSAIFPITDEKNIITKTRKVRLTVPGDLIASLQTGTWGGQSKLLGFAVKEFGESVSAVKIVKLPARRKPVAVTTEGKTVTLYRVIGVRADEWGGVNRTTDFVLAEGFSSQADARAKAIKLAEQDVKDRNGSGYSSFEVRPYQLRDTGDAAVVKITVPVAESGTVEAEVTFTDLKANAPVIGWNVYFDYHH